MMETSGRARLFARLVAQIFLIAVVPALLAAPAEPAGSTNLENFAKCVGSKATMYGSFWCRHCEDQKNLFGDSFKYIHYVECSRKGSREMTLACQVAMIRYTPTWDFAGGERKTGLLSLQEISDRTGCRLP